MKGKKNVRNIVIIFLVTLVILFQLFYNDRYEGHDTIFHVTNIIRLSDTISFNNIFGSNIITYDFNSYGYGVWLFYPKIPHLVASYVYLILKDIYLSMNIVYFITTFLSGVFIYFLTDKIFKNKKVSLLSSVIYLTFPYHICEIYTRDAFAENFMFMVLPMIFLGLYNLKDNNYMKFYILFILGYVIGINSHLVSMVYYTFFILIFIIYYRNIFFKKDKFLSLLISSFIVMGLCLPFIVSLLEHKALGIYRVFKDYFITLSYLKMMVIDFKSLFIQKAISGEVLTYFSKSTIILFILAIYNFIFNREDCVRKDKRIFLIFIVIVINFICSKELWNYIPKLFLSIQFPWRLLVFLSLFISLFCSSVFLNKNKFILVRKVLLVIFLIFSIFDGLNNIRYYTDYEVSVDYALNSDYSLGYQYEYFADFSVLTQLKYGKDYFKYRKDGIILDGIGDALIKDDKFPNMDFVVNNILDEIVIELPRSYYLGYELIDESGKEIALFNNENGFLSAIINKDGEYKLRYVKTDLYRIALLIRMITFIVILLVLVVKFLKWRRKRLLY